MAIAVLVAVAILALPAVVRDATAQLQQTRYGDGTTVIGELRAGHSAGQTFRAQHDGLAAVELRLATYARVNPGTVVLHLRQDVTHTLDLATVRVAAGDLADNAWQRFAFPPIAHSAGREYYVELEHPGAAPGEAITVYWTAQAGDPYPYGRATADRAPLDGDLAFGLDYAAPPSALWTDLARTLAAQIPARLVWVLIGAAALGTLLLAILLTGATRGWFGGRPARQALLGVLLAGCALAHGLVYMTVVPPWQGPDEFAHYAYAATLAAGALPTDTSPAAREARARIEANILAAMDARGFTRFVDWYPAPGGPAAAFVTQPGGSTMYWETRQPPLYYQLAAGLLRAYSADPAGVPADIGLYLVRLTSVLWSTLVVVLAWGCARLLAPGPRFRMLWVALPLTILLLPQRAFIDSMTNNDVLAELAGALLAFVLFAAVGLRRLRLWSATGLLGLGLPAFLLGLAAKLSTMATPGAVLWVGGVATVLGRTGVRLNPPRARGVPWLIAGGAALLVLAGGAAVVATGFGRPGVALAWTLAPDRPATQVKVADAHAGSAVLLLPAQALGEQRVALPAGHPAGQFTFRVWARPAPGAAPGRLTINLAAESVPLTGTAGVLTMADAAGWQPVTATATIPPGLTVVRALLQADTATQVDDARLQVDGWPATMGAVVLRNPSMEEAALAVRPDSALGRLLARLPAALQADLTLETLVNPQAFDKAAIVGAYLGDEFRSYWGWFGWLGGRLQLPSGQYALWAAVCGVALLGWGSGWWTRPRSTPRVRVLGGLVLLALGSAVAVSLARQMMLLATSGFHDFPQGRYLFVLIVPVTWLLLVGLTRAALCCGPWRVRLALVRWGAWLGLGGLLYLDLYALVAILLPYYYGRF
jgi:hypothetical protein